MLDDLADSFDCRLSDSDSTLALAPAPWFDGGCGQRGSGSHRLAEVVDGRLDLTGLDGRVGARLVGLHRRIASAVVEQLPRPIECIGLADSDDLIHEIELEWSRCGHGFPTDPAGARARRGLDNSGSGRKANWCI